MDRAKTAAIEQVINAHSKALWTFEDGILGCLYAAVIAVMKAGGMRAEEVTAAAPQLVDEMVDAINAAIQDGTRICRRRLRHGKAGE